jgi:hypothetical protein
MSQLKDMLAEAYNTLGVLTLSHQQKEGTMN